MSAFKTAAAAVGALFLTAVSMASSVQAGTVCLKLEGERETTLVSLAPDSDLQLSFLHSIYGSRVEERFRVTPAGFQPADLRYSDLRAAEYYGHASARFEGDVWIVDGGGQHLSRLELRVSDDSFIRVALSIRSWLVQKDAPLGSHVILSVTQCAKENSGR